MVYRSTLLAMRRDRIGPGASLQNARRLIRVLGVVLLVACGAPLGKAQEKQSGSAMAPEAAFAFSDFDGDRRPDLAVGQPGRSDRSFTDYWVQLKLTTAGIQSIRVVGPTGGLQVAARDVNGDDVPDLVLTTTWRNQPVAILLNDGAGGFSRVDPNVLPGAFSNSETSWSNSAARERILLAAVTQYRAGFVPAVLRVPYLRASAKFRPRGQLVCLLNSAPASHAGRAPPLISPRSKTQILIR